MNSTWYVASCGWAHPNGICDGHDNILRIDAQSEDLLRACAERGIHSRGDLDLAVPAPLDVERLARILRDANIGCEDHTDLQGGYHLVSAHKEDAEHIAFALSNQPSTEPAQGENR